jgi:hypothetical protein
LIEKNPLFLPLLPTKDHLAGCSWVFIFSNDAPSSRTLIYLLAIPADWVISFGTTE